MKTTAQLLTEAYESLIELSHKDGNAAVARRNIFLALENIKEKQNITYFYNEKGDYSIVYNLNESDQKILAVCKSEEDALKITSI